MNDTERLDWLEKTFSGVTNRERYLPVTMGWGKACNGRSLREAIDKYMDREVPKQDGIQRGNADLVPAEKNWCPSCDGKGWEDTPEMFVNCPHCLGTGEVPAETQADDGWIAWAGSEDGSLPEGLSEFTKVEVQLREYTNSDSKQAHEWDWTHGGLPWDIIAYRVVPSKTEDLRRRAQIMLDTAQMKTMSPEWLIREMEDAATALLEAAEMVDSMESVS